VTGIIVTGAGGSTTITTDNGTLQLSAAVSPANATNQSVTWSITNGTGQATISTSGLVTAQASGTVTARATANDGSGIYGQLVVTISNQFIPVSSISVTGPATITTEKGTAQLTATVSPSNSTTRTVTWSLSSGSSLATISSSGLVTAAGNGVISARATATDGTGIYGQMSITISNQAVVVSGITVTGAGGESSISFDKGTLQLTAIVTPVDATDKSVTWSITAGTDHATISQTGLVTARSNGTVTARATANDGSGTAGEIVIEITNQTVHVSIIEIEGEGGERSIR
jgi:uncharacterized protein YjdB